MTHMVGIFAAEENVYNNVHLVRGNLTIQTTFLFKHGAAQYCIEYDIALSSDGSFLWPVYLIVLRLQIVAYESSNLGVCIKLSSLEVLDICCDSKFLDACQVGFLFVLHFIWCFAIDSTSGSVILKPCHVLHCLFPQKLW